MNTWFYKMALGALALAIGLPGAARAQSANNGCSNATLVGDYTFTVNGQVFPPGSPVVTRDGVALTHFDGKGGVTQVDFVMQYPDKMGGASPVPNGDAPDSVTSFNVGETGTYTVFEDCTGQMEIDFPPINGGGAIIKLRFALSNEGTVIHTTVYYAKPPDMSCPAGAPVPCPVAALIHSEGHKLGAVATRSSN